MKTRQNSNPVNEAMELNPQSMSLLESWSREIGAINQAFDGNLPLMKQVTTAMLLESATRYIDGVSRQMNLNEATQPMDVGYFKKYAINLLSAVIPNLIAHDIVSVQPMLSRVGEVRYLKILFGSNKGAIQAGSTMMSTLVGGNGEFNYSSDQVDSEVVDTTTTSVTGNLAWTPVVPGTVEFIFDDTNIVKDDGAGHLSGDAISAGTVNYNTGAFSLTLKAAASSAIVNYSYNNMDVPVKAPEVTLKIESSPIIAKSRKLKAVYAFDASYDMSRDYGMEINNELITYTGAQIKHEIDGEIMNDLKRIATAAPTTWDATPRDGISVRDHNESFYNTIVEAGNNIFDATKLANASFVIGGVGVANIIETLPRFRPAGALRPVGPHLAGYLGNMPFYKNPYFSPDEYVVGWKGSGLFDAGFIYAPYMPIMSTQLIMDAEFQGSRGFATSYGKKPVNSNFYSKGAITHS